MPAVPFRDVFESLVAQPRSKRSASPARRKVRELSRPGLERFEPRQVMAGTTIGDSLLLTDGIVPPAAVVWTPPGTGEQTSGGGSSRPAMPSPVVDDLIKDFKANVERWDVPRDPGSSGGEPTWIDGVSCTGEWPPRLPPDLTWLPGPTATNDQNSVSQMVQTFVVVQSAITDLEGNQPRPPRPGEPYGPPGPPAPPTLPRFPSDQLYPGGDIYLGMSGEICLGVGVNGGFGIVVDIDDVWESGIYITGGPSVGVNVSGGPVVGSTSGDIEGDGVTLNLPGFSGGCTLPSRDPVVQISLSPPDPGVSVSQTYTVTISPKSVSQAVQTFIAVESALADLEGNQPRPPRPGEPYGPPGPPAPLQPLH